MKGKLHVLEVDLAQLEEGTCGAVLAAEAATYLWKVNELERRFPEERR